MSDQQRQSRLIAAGAHAVTCTECELPSIEIRAGALIVRNKHHGKTHTNSFSLEWLRSKIAESTGQSTDSLEASR